MASPLRMFHLHLFSYFPQHSYQIQRRYPKKLAHWGIRGNGVNGLWHIKFLNLLIYAKNGFRGFLSQLLQMLVAVFDGMCCLVREFLEFFLCLMG